LMVLSQSLGCDDSAAMNPITKPTLSSMRIIVPKPECLRRLSCSPCSRSASETRDAERTLRHPPNMLVAATIRALRKNP
jgi:hypothetical protein